MKGRWIPFLATTAALALVAVAPAQSRGRSGGGDSGSSRSGGGDSRPSRSNDSRPSGDSGRSSRSNDSRPNGDSGRSSRPSDSRPSGDSRSSRSGGDTRTSRPGDIHPTGDARSPRTDDRRTRDRSGDASQGRTGGSTSRPDERAPRAGNDARPTGTGTGDRPSRSRGDHTEGSGRRGPFDQSSGRGTYSRSGEASHGSTDRVFQGDRYAAPVRNRPSRSGTVSYGTFHNGYGSARPTRYTGGFDHSVLGVQIRHNQPHVGHGDYHYGGVYGGVRYGYVGYNSYWRDDYFAYPYYAFDPWAPGVTVVASPWYRYSYLPPYLDTNRVVIVNGYTPSYDEGRDDWRDYGDRRNDRLDDALGDIRDAFERNSSRYGERLLPQTGQVAIFNDGKYDYSLGADDFQDMFLDGIEGSKTTKYEITETRVRGDEVHLKARHEYTDSWGEPQVVYHTYTLRRENGRYVIREFGTD